MEPTKSTPVDPLHKRAEICLQTSSPEDEFDNVEVFRSNEKRCCEISASESEGGSELTLTVYKVRQRLINDILLRLRLRMPTVDVFGTQAMHVCDIYWGDGNLMHKPFLSELFKRRLSRTSSFMAVSTFWSTSSFCLEDPHSKADWDLDCASLEGEAMVQRHPTYVV